jgi:Asp-tRNA(Asn)/Glu-tRNA(Gln) amidotransferase A subunit family amidase
MTQTPPPRFGFHESLPSTVSRNSPGEIPNSARNSLPKWLASANHHWAADDPPVGAQLVAGPWDEAVLIRLASALEPLVGWTDWRAL